MRSFEIDQSPYSSSIRLGALDGVIRVFVELENIGASSYTKFQDNPCSGSQDIVKNMQKIGKKNISFKLKVLTIPYKLSKNQFCAQ